jgi:hypothetical protein
MLLNFDNSKMQDIPAPIATLDLGDTENLEKNYKNFIEKLVQTVIEDTDVEFKFTDEAKKIKRSVPVTPGVDYSPTGSGNFSFDLLVDNTGLRVVCDKYQWWFRGIVTADGRRYEIDDAKHPKVMTGSSSLHTNGMYPKLLSDSVNICKVGYQSLRRAVQELAKLGRKGRDLGMNYKTAIAVVLVMCFEAARLRELFDFCLSLLKDKKDDQVGEKNRLLINGWSDTSRDFYEENGGTKEIVISPTTSANVRKVYDGVQILCRSRWDRWIETNVPQPKKQSKVRKG